MKKLIKPASLLLNLLSLLSFFAIGLLYAGWIEAGKNQGLAAGAIVLGYGVVFAFVGLILSFFASFKLKHKIIVRLNIALTIILFGAMALIFYNAQQRKKQKKVENNEIEQPKTTKPVDQGKFLVFNNLPAKKLKSSPNPVGIGFFKPNFFENPVLHFFAKPNLEKALNEHSPITEARFVKNEIGNYEVAEAPPWFSPIHSKLDYGILYFRVISLSSDFVEVIGNEHNSYSTFLSRRDGELIFWPDFLLRVNSIEILENRPQLVKSKPLEHAPNVTATFSFMKPVLIKDEWIQVKLFDNNYVEKGKGWIRWNEEGRLLISYSLLS